MEWMHAHAHEVAWGVVGGTVALSFLVWLLGRRTPELGGNVGKDLLHAAAPPLQFALWYYAAFFATPYVLDFLNAEGAKAWFEAWRGHFWHLGLITGMTWFLYRTVRVVGDFLSRRAERTAGSLDDYLFRIAAGALRTLIPLFGLMALLRLVQMPKEAWDVVQTVLAGVFIVAIAAILYRAVLDGERTLLSRIDEKADLYHARAVQTRVRILRKFAVVFLSVIALAGVLLLLPGVRTLGTSILASAGVAGIVLGIAAQRTLGSFFAGLQIALTQPIRLGDQVVAQGESGNVEEITLSYVVVRTWDGRRLILPINWFLEQPFQNWTRPASAMIATVKLRVDFSLPLAPVREEMKAWVEASPLWDQKVYAFQVTDSDAATMEIRVIAGVPGPGQSFDMQCGVREKLLTFLQQNYPHCLPRSRQETIWSELNPPPGKQS